MSESMYVRVKRPKQTVFLSTEPSETIGVAKNKLAAMCEFPADSIRLGFNGSILMDDKTIGEYKIENSNVLFQIQKIDGEWENLQDIEEAVKIQNPE